jgi:hypothetical protein
MTERQDNGEYKETDKHRGKKESYMTETETKLCRKDIETYSSTLEKTS